MSDVLYTNEMLAPREDGYHLTDYGERVAEIKRVLEYYTMDAEFAQQWKQNSRKALKHIGIDIEPRRIRRLLEAEYADDPITEEVEIYRQFIENKIKSRCYMQQSGCVPKNSDIAGWREQQIKRCWIEMGARNQSLIHAPLMFELSDGCSVGCGFCGLNAGKLKKICMHTEENALLFRQILRYMKELLGKAAGSGTCYYATEPLDNPDYEKYIGDYYDILGTVPQTTTAAAMRDTDRTKHMLYDFSHKYNTIHRFSVLNLEEFHEIMERFTPIELLNVELIPQFEEAPSNHFSCAGRNRCNDEYEGGYNIETICCISGFIINMARREIRLISPCGVDSEHPTGEKIFCIKKFENFEEFKSTIEEIIKTHMNGLDNKRKLSFYSYIDVTYLKQGIRVASRSGYENHFIGIEAVRQDIFGLMARLLEDKGMCADDMAIYLEDAYGIEPMYTFFAIGKLYRAGFLEMT